MVEFPSSSSAASAGFFKDVFGWENVAYGPDYHDVASGEVTLGFQGDLSEAPDGPLVVIEVDDLAAARTRLIQAGATITVEPFSFPGGSRMHFREPGGSELAVYVRDAK